MLLHTSGSHTRKNLYTSPVKPVQASSDQDGSGPTLCLGNLTEVDLRLAHELHCTETAVLILILITRAQT